MMKYKVVIEELVSDTFEVIANSKDAALDIVKQNYLNGKFVLEPGELQQARVTCLSNGGQLIDEWRIIV